MANAVYDLARQGAVAASVGSVWDWAAHNIKLSLVRSSAYTPNMATDQFLDPAATTRVADSGNFTTKTTTAGVCDADNVTFSAVGAGAAIQYLLCWRDTATPTTSPLIFLIDTATGLPVTPNGGDITVTWDDGANKIFKI